MCEFGRALVGGGGCVRWTLTPFVLLFAVGMPLLVPDWTFVGVAVMAGLELMCLCLLAGFWLPRRLGFGAFRILGGVVFLVYAAYLVYEVFVSDRPFAVSPDPGEPSPFNALLGFVLIGIPGLWLAVLGRFSPGRPPELDEDADCVEKTYDD